MDKIRAIINGEPVYGWYCREYSGRHYMINSNEDLWAVGLAADPVLRPSTFNPASAAVATGKLAKDKDGKEVKIFGSKEPFQGGDRVKVGGVQFDVEWWEDQLCWGVKGVDTGVFWSGLSEYNKLEIIPKETSEQEKE